MKTINLIILVTFLFTNTVYPAPSNTLRVPMGASKRAEETIGAIKAKGDIRSPYVGHVEPVVDAYEAALEKRYDEAYQLLMEGLLGKDYVVNIEIAVRILEMLMTYYEKDIDKAKELTGLLYIVKKYQSATNQRKMKDELAAFRIAWWAESDIESDVETLIKSGQVFSLGYPDKERADKDRSIHSASGATKELNLRKGIIVIRDEEDAAPLSGRGTDYIKKVSVKSLSKGSLKSVSEKLGFEVKPISKDGVKYLVHSDDLITSRPQLWLLGRTSEMTEDDVGSCLRSIGKDINTKPSFKKAIAKKLIKLQQKRPETISLIREKALELLEINEDNFREALAPFIGDYIAIRGAIRETGIADNTAEFYRVFDKILSYMSDIDEGFVFKAIEVAKDMKDLQELKNLYKDIIPEVVKTIDNALSFAINSRLWKKWDSNDISIREMVNAITFQRNYGGFRVTSKVIYPVTHSEGHVVDSEGRIKKIQITAPLTSLKTLPSLSSHDYAVSETLVDAVLTLMTEGQLDEVLPELSKDIARAEEQGLLEKGRFIGRGVRIADDLFFGGELLPTDPHRINKNILYLALGSCKALRVKEHFNNLLQDLEPIDLWGDPAAAVDTINVPREGLVEVLSEALKKSPYLENILEETGYHTPKDFIEAQLKNAEFEPPIIGGAATTLNFTISSLEAVGYGNLLDEYVIDEVGKNGVVIVIPTEYYNDLVIEGKFEEHTFAIRETRYGELYLKISKNIYLKDIAYFFMQPGKIREYENLTAKGPRGVIKKNFMRYRDRIRLISDCKKMQEEGVDILSPPKFIESEREIIRIILQHPKYKEFRGLFANIDSRLTSIAPPTDL